MPDDTQCQLHNLIQWNKAQGLRACKGRISYSNRKGWYIRPCHSKTCFECHMYGARMINRMNGTIWRAIGNLLSVYRLYFITITPVTLTGDYTDDWNHLLISWGKVLRSARNRHGSFEFFRLAVQGKVNPHLHIIATVPIEPQNSLFPDLDIHCREIGNTPDDIAKVARYMRKNLLTLPQHITNRVSTSRAFFRWSNPAIWRVLDRFSVDVYTAHRSIQSDTMQFTPCRECKHYFPESDLWFQRSGSNRFRSLCKLCEVFEDRALNANKRARHAGIDGTITYQDVKQLFENARRGDKYVCYHTGSLIHASEVSIDHIQPLCHGGTNTLDNLCITSKRMNGRKGSKPLNQWKYTIAGMGYRPDYLPSDMPIQRTLWNQ